MRSPDSVYLYWELTDEAIAAARERLGAGGAWGWCNLRVYDTTGRAFDGVNANDYFDVHVERTDRDYFLSLHRPTASFHVEIGVKSHEGFFQAIARSGRADLPRKGPSPSHALEWMTVTSDDSHPAAQPYVSKYAGPPPSPLGASPRAGPSAPHAGARTHDAGRASPRGIVGNNHVESRSFTWMHPAHMEVRWEGPWLFDSWRTEWRLHWVGGDLGRVGAEGRAILPIEKAQWRVGPFPIHVLDSGRIEIRLLGDGPVALEEHVSGLEVFGPWEVTIRSFPTEPERRVLGSWRVHWARVEPAKLEQWLTAFERRRVNVWERAQTVGGASESRALVEGGASEMWRLGASERLALGGSEWLALGGSEIAWLGASQLLLGGASALLYGGASGVVWGGASERAWGGASEWAYGGASEAHGFGASEHFAGSAPLRGSEAYAGHTPTPAAAAPDWGRT